MPRFTPAYLDELRARLRASDVIGRHVKLKKEGREYRGLSPFTTEKTPSFYVNDEKAKFFDFSSGKSGDIIGFLMETQRLDFVAAVTQLSEMAGLEVPQDTPEDRKKAERAKTLAEAMVEAARYYRQQLGRSEGRGALGYLHRRGVSEGAREAFGLGYAPGSRSALKDALVEKGFALPTLIEAGLLIAPEDGGAPYDRFRDRLMFPILGSGGRVIAFGGRALSKDVSAKYLNSPETPLFHKSATLYNLGQARRRLSGDDPLILAEGYMDVIALHEAGFAAVAPLGTAVTPQQLSALWRVVDNPVLCLDGDRAGRAAAFRAIDRALPLLSPGKSLRFAFLPEGQDPDDLYRQSGRKGIEEVLGATRPLSEVLWERQREEHPAATPEERAGFRTRLRELTRTIADPDVRREYAAFFAERLMPQEGQVRSRDNGDVFGFRRPAEKAPVTGGIVAKDARRLTESFRHTRERQIVGVLMLRPALLDDFDERILNLRLRHVLCARMLSHIIQIYLSEPIDEYDQIIERVEELSGDPDTVNWCLNDPLLRITYGLQADNQKIHSAFSNQLGLIEVEEIETELPEIAKTYFRSEEEERRWKTTVAEVLRGRQALRQ